MSFYTRKGDDGTTGLFYGGRVRKDDAAPEAYGTVDEAQACCGLARAHAPAGGELDGLLLEVERHLYVLMAELATLPENHAKLKPGLSLVTDEMVAFVEHHTDDLSARFPMPTEFVLPGQNPCSASLEVARTVVRRAERRSVAVAVEGSHVIPYLNRLSSLLWAMARWQDGGAVPAKVPSTFSSSPSKGH
ncbi:MAG: ATP:Cob(I)alamin adenosyltransferase [uncultured Acidimicrobiales bacterium]|uniref:Corrinoid adenosyltransferase n=1 Tax=uncultured Acidimicrobiales bacterium TaxID=310071 RepID=A0A6J4I2G9_9ACTN|nr:MAG: ATP:Cob(I)alamin adenosyltransferase [uncultured Acidimicrobiales bacterium]